VEVCLATGAHYLQRATLQGIGATLTTPSMIRIRRSAIINVDHITSRLSGGRLRLKSGRIVTIGRTYRADVEALLNIPRPVTTIAPVTPSIPASPSVYRAPAGSDRAREQRVQ
jgi:hypothetical protein